MKIVEQGIFLLEIENEIACMSFNPDNPKYPFELINSSFQRELKFLQRVEKYFWAPEVINIDITNRKIFLRWYGNTCDTSLPINWKPQLENITRDLHCEKIYKPNFYPKCFYTDNNGILHAFVFYSCSEYSEQPIDIEFYKPILNEDRLKTIKEISKNNKVDMKLLIERAFKNYIHWPDRALADIYERVYE